ncbi:hypothetical protein CLAFUW4_14635 [Fulvia fulva]|uniref:AB hydrolase-1 domain-containing protein n=1 Tax=Passalora fulva TaxID=5499 RepID=A0A9Q8PLP8_PASFU|nr:uncharacterized protein CLAFUR5_14464 [Fulvia fulva]KAK4609836.1 hypothetical protein CLAFUR0_14629 [Fulvia fulva]UJO24914.1 hypothetical protein CLAFUR5_14464 [Fulvia fulva]WPV22895.1 hypothetical protein CLAFUW4_14635 [Fulvia fulva]
MLHLYAPSATASISTFQSLATSYDLDILRVDNNIDAVNFALDIDRWKSPNTTERMASSTNVTATYTIYAELCAPTTSNEEDVIQILTHGAIFDHRYWDAAIDPAQYPYVQAALEAGYTVFTYDRLCNGLSDKPDAYTIGQGPTELEIPRALTEMVRSGTLSKSLHEGSVLNPVAPFEKAVHIGHSFGSQLTAALLTSYGHLSSGAILTGLLFATHTAQASTAQLGFEFAATNNPALFGDRGSGYIVPSDVSKLELNLFHRYNDTDASDSTDGALAFAEGIKQPLTVGEWMSLRGLLDVGMAPAFTGPLQFFAAEYDALVCGGDCKSNYDLATLDAIYPNASAKEVSIQPGAGHRLTLHRNASAGYAVMMDFLESNGL